jgi:serine/threonine protein kinase
VCSLEPERACPYCCPWCRSPPPHPPTPPWACHVSPLLHCRRVIHRDLKPENFLLRHAERELRPEALRGVDFGLAKALPPGGEVCHSRVGSSYYVAPEVLKVRPHLSSPAALLPPPGLPSPAFPGCPTLPSDCLAGRVGPAQRQ